MTIHAGVHRAETCPFSFDGEPLRASPGDTIAAALAAAGRLELRRTRSGAARGLHCGMGACFDCLVTVDGRIGVRACLEKARPGMDVRSASPSPEDMRDLAARPDTHIEEAVDVLVVGAGPAGATVAAVVAEAGASVIVADERPLPGGQYFKPLAVPAEGDAAADRQFAEGAALAARLAASGARLWTEATVWSAAIDEDGIGIFRDGRAVVVRPSITVLATGAAERPYPIPGWTLPGVMTTGGLQSLVRSHHVTPGRRIAIAGSGPLNFQLACELLKLGVAPVAVVDEAPRPGWSCAGDLARMAAADPRLTLTGMRYLAALASARVPLLWDARPVRISGDGRAGKLELMTAKGGMTLDVDIVALNAGFVPQVELARQLGCVVAYTDAHVGALTVETDAVGRTSNPGVFALGDGARIAGARVALARAELASRAILERLGRPVPAGPDQSTAVQRLARAERFQDALWRVFRQAPFDPAALPDETIVCRCEEVSAGHARTVCREVEPSLATIKRMTRAGMGRCQGRFCSGTLTRLVAAEGGAQPDTAAFFAPRPPAKPVPLAALALEKPEWGGHRRALPPAISPRVNRNRRPFGRIETDVAVIGAGIVGASVARELALAGLAVTVVDRHEPNVQASGANAGSLHVQLLSFDFGTKAQAGGRPAAEVLRIAPASIRLWQDLEREAGEDLEIRTSGGLMVGESEQEMRFLEQKVALERSYGIDSHLIGANELRALEPGLARHLIGASFCRDEGKINPLTATYAVTRLARAAGVRFEGFATVTGLSREGGRWRLETESGAVIAPRVVNCAGGWASRIAAMALRPIPVAGAPLQMIVTEAGPPLVAHLIAHAGRHLSLKQAATGGLIIGGAWTAALDPETGASRVERDSVEGNAWVACHVLPAAAGLRIVRIWAAMNIDIDGAPIIGEMPGAPGFFNCVTSSGYSLAPIVARMTAELMTRGRSDHPVELFSLARFDATP